MKAMVLVAFLIGCLATFGLIVLNIHLRSERFLSNPNPDWSCSGMIPRGNAARLDECLQNIFPIAPARSYIQIHRYAPERNSVAMTSFFIRSAGKRNGVHSFKGELRLSVEERHHAIDAIPMLERLGPVGRTDKSHGQLILETAKLAEIDELLAVEKEFRFRVLQVSDEGPFTVHWHIPRSLSEVGSL